MTNPNTHFHGGHPERDARRLNVDTDQVLDFSTNLSPLGPPRELLDRWPDLSAEISRYPDPHGSGIRDYFCEQYSLDPEHVLAGNGVSELIYLLQRALQPDRLVLHSPSFHDYERSAPEETDVTFLPLVRNRDLNRPDHVEYESSLAESDLHIRGNPGNPTGQSVRNSKLLERVRNHPDCRFVIDEAFVRFTDRPKETSLLKRVPEEPNLIILRSLTKFYTIPGLRAGAMIAPPDIIRACRSLRAPWMVNRVADRAVSSLRDLKSYDQRVRNIIRSGRDRVRRAFRSIPGVTLLPSNANFFLARWTRTPDLDDLLRRLLKHGLYVRDARNFRGLDGEWFRFALRTESENDRLIDVFRSF